ncbi:carbohydrate sulfotransferase 11 [Biomphalaria glabrata]|nr:carbohydrate sulfotransferase 11 [Biomphalaria glabrata]
MYVKTMYYSPDLTQVVTDEVGKYRRKIPCGNVTKMRLLQRANGATASTIMRIPIRLLIAIPTVIGALAPILLLLTNYWPSTRHHTDSRLLVTSFSDGNRVGLQTGDADVKVTSAPVSPEWWRNHLKINCRKLGYNGNRNFSKTLLQNIIVDDRHKAMYCLIPKVASTTWRRIFLLLSGYASVENITSILPNEIYDKSNKYLKRLSVYTKEEIEYRVDNYFKFVFVREPYERLLSAFRNKFLVNTNSSSYFKGRFGKKIIKNYRFEPESDPDGNGVKFSEFVDYLLDKKRKIAMNEHWETFYKMCAPCKIKYDFVGKMESMLSDTDFVLSQISPEIKFHLPSRTELRYSHNKTSDFMKDFYRQLSRHSIFKLYQMYRNDFLLFNYSIPLEILNILSENSTHSLEKIISKNEIIDYV